MNTEKSKYYILRDLDDLEWFFKLDLLDYKHELHVPKDYFKEQLKHFIEWKGLVYVYSTEDNQYCGWDYLHQMVEEKIQRLNLTPIDFKVELRKMKLEILNKEL